MTPAAEVKASYVECPRCHKKYPEPLEFYHPADQCAPEYDLSFRTPEEALAFAETAGEETYVAGCPLCDLVVPLPTPEVVNVTEHGMSLRRAQLLELMATANKHVALYESALRDHCEESHS